VIVGRVVGLAPTLPQMRLRGAFSGLLSPGWRDYLPTDAQYTVTHANCKHADRGISDFYQLLMIHPAKNVLAGPQKIASGKLKQEIIKRPTPKWVFVADPGVQNAIPGWRRLVCNL
jgi:hypothetical protein